MKAIDTKSAGSCNGPQTGSNCVIWQGVDVPSLGVKKGEAITQTLCTILNKLIEATSPLDLTTVSIQALKDKLGVEEPVQRSIATMLQIAYDSSSTLKDLIDLAIAKIDGTAKNLVLDLKCLSQFDSYGTLQAYDQQSVFQLLINQACGINDDITTINGKITDLTNQVNDLNVDPFTEPLVTSCLFSAKPASQAVVILASDSCGYKQIVGQTTDVQAALGQVPSDWTQTYGLTTGWTLSPTNMAQSFANAILVIQNLESRLSTIENSCCKINCDSIIVDFDIKLSDDRETATLFFATKSNIPVGFFETDPLGTKLTITDAAGAVFTTRVKIIDQLANADGFVIDLNASPLDPSLDYTFNLGPTLSNGSLTCVKCINKVAKYTETCSFCEITANNIGSSNSTAVITYQEIGSTKIQMIVLHPGETQVIKKHVKILSVATDGPISLESPCNIDLAATETYQCVQARFAVTQGTAAWEISPAFDTEIVEVGYLDKRHTITGGVIGQMDWVSAVKNALPVGVSLYTMDTPLSPTGARQKIKLLLKIPSSLIPSFYIKFKVVDFGPVKVFVEPCDESNGACCPATSDNDTQLIA